MGAGSERIESAPHATTAASNVDAGSSLPSPDLTQRVPVSTMQPQAPSAEGAGGAGAEDGQPGPGAACRDGAEVLGDVGWGSYADRMRKLIGSGQPQSSNSTGPAGGGRGTGQGSNGRGGRGEPVYLLSGEGLSTGYADAGESRANRAADAQDGGGEAQDGQPQASSDGYAAPGSYANPPRSSPPASSAAPSGPGSVDGSGRVPGQRGWTSYGRGVEVPASGRPDGRYPDPQRQPSQGEVADARAALRSGQSRPSHPAALAPVGPRPQVPSVQEAFAAYRPPPEPGAFPSERLVGQPRKKAPDRGVRRAIWKATGGLVNLGDSKQVAELLALQDKLGLPLKGTPLVIVSLSLKGGSGKTTAIKTVGDALAIRRGGKVLAIDANADEGTLMDRTPAAKAATVLEMAAAAEQRKVSRIGDMLPLVAQDPSGLHIIGSDQDSERRRGFSAEQFSQIVQLGGMFYELIMVDLGTDMTHPVAQAALECADAAMLVSRAAVDECRKASRFLTTLHQQYPRLQRRTTLAVTESAKKTVDISVLERHFADAEVPSVRIPYDQSLDHGDVISRDALGRSTQAAFTELGAHVVDALAGSRR
jgi:MinD-like ATPase involved in chromosome partitioning or flagellar assembly